MQEFSFLYTLDEIGQAASRIIGLAGGLRIWLLDGDMGTGKTTLIKAICRALGAVDELSSPTYSIANEYGIQGGTDRIFHLDLYRLRSVNEAMDIGIEEYLYSGAYCIVEWPGLIMPLLKKEAFMHIHLTAISENERKIHIFINKD